MKNSMWGLMFIMFGIIGVIFIIIFQDVTTSNDQNYSLLKETTEAAFVDAFDWNEWYNSGKIQIYKDKFVESFFKRFALSVSTLRAYEIRIYDIQHEPPRAMIEVSSWTGTATYGNRPDEVGGGTSINIRNRIDAILEKKGGKVNE